MTTVIGNDSAVEQGKGYSWTSENGETQTHSWDGPAAKVEAKYNELRDNPGNYGELAFQKTKGRGTLTAKVLTGIDGSASIPSTQVVTTYELRANDIYKPIESAPYWTDEGLTSARIADILHRVENAYGTAERYHDGNLSTELTGAELKLYNHLARGYTEYLESGYVLRRNQIGARESALQASYTGVNTVVDPPDASTVNPIIESLPVGEWLKRPPVVTSLANNRYQISEEWWWAEAWSVVYGGTLHA